jgi:prolyl-tRNA editing enzyme YbaK/EbsC (Cys-tRNA(Pro) deacylase)
VLVIASGAHRVDESKVAALAGEAIGKADARFVRAATGYAIGGIAAGGQPRARLELIASTASLMHARTFIDRNLLAYETVYAAGGTPHAMFPITPAELVRVAHGTVADTAP